MIYRGLEWLHPRAKIAFGQLNEELQMAYSRKDTPTLFRLFETYRSPERQAELLRIKTTKAGPWRSAHQYGVACDFVPYMDGKWSWDRKHDWDFLRAAARRLGLKNEIEWDRAHVEHPIWEEIQKAIRY